MRAIVLASSLLAATAVAQVAQEPELEPEPEPGAESDAESEPESASEPETHVVRVTSTPEGAAVSVDGEDTGALAPTELDLGAGEYEIRGSLDGHHADHHHIEVPAQSEVHLTLVPIVPEPPRRVPQPASVLNYIFAGTLLAAGIAVATGPLITTIRAGECASSCDDPSEAERYEVGTQTVVWLSVSAALFAGALVFALARPIRASASVSRDSARLTLDATF